MSLNSNTFTKEYLDELKRKGPYCGIYNYPPDIIAKMIIRPTTPLNLYCYRNETQVEHKHVT